MTANIKGGGIVRTFMHKDNSHRLKISLYICCLIMTTVYIDLSSIILLFKDLYHCKWYYLRMKDNEHTHTPLFWEWFKINSVVYAMWKKNLHEIKFFMKIVKVNQKLSSLLFK